MVETCSLDEQVTCGVCHRESVRFDPFNYLSLPLPLESYVHTEVTGALPPIVLKFFK